MNASPREKSPRRAELVEAAYHRLASAGFEGLRTRDIAAEVGVNVATLHYYFPTKEALIRAAVIHATSRFAATIGGEGTREEMLRAHFAGLRRLLREEPELPAVMGEVALRSGRDPAMADVMRTADNAWHGWLVRMLGPDRADSAGKAALIMATLRGLLMLPGVSQSPERLDQAFSELERAVLS